jgi:archaeal flagellar protein FlaI
LASYLDELKAQMAKDIEKANKNIDVKKTETQTPETKKEEISSLSLGSTQKKEEPKTAPTTTTPSPEAKPKEQPKLDNLKDAFSSISQELEKTIPKQSAESLKSLMGDIKDEREADALISKWERTGTVITKYGDTEVYRVPDEPLFYYKTNIPKPSPSQKLIINTLKEATTRLVSTDPYKIRDPKQRQNIYYQKILEILENAPEINVPKHLFDFYAKAVVTEMVGYGVIDTLIHDTKLEEIMIIGPKKPVYIYHRDYGMMYTNIIFYSDDEIQDIIDKIARILGRRVDISNPLLDARLPDGSRVNATIPPASIDGSTITIRKFREDPYTIVDLVNFGTINLEVAAFLWCCVEGLGAKPANILISGGTGSGKTTLLNVLANFIPDSSRVLTIEDTAELKLPIKHIIRFEGKPPGLEGTGELTLDILVKNTLRMRPDRIIVGEIRHAEASTLFTAMNTGHDGCMGTIHANSARETLVRITSPPMDVPMLMLAGLDFIIVEKRMNTSRGLVRRIVEIAEITGVYENSPKASIIFKWNPQTDNLERTNEPIRFFDIIKTYTKYNDADIKHILEERINLINDFVKKNIRNITEVSKMVQEVYTNNSKKNE